MDSSNYGEILQLYYEHSTEGDLPTVSGYACILALVNKVSWLIILMSRLLGYEMQVTQQTQQGQVSMFEEVFQENILLDNYMMSSVCPLCLIPYIFSFKL